MKENEEIKVSNVDSQSNKPSPSSHQEKPSTNNVMLSKEPSTQPNNHVRYAEINKKMVETFTKETPTQSSFQFVQLVDDGKTKRAFNLPYQEGESSRVYQHKFRIGNLIASDFLSSKLREFNNGYNISENLLEKILFRPIALPLPGQAKPEDTDFKLSAFASWLPTFTNKTDSHLNIFVYVFFHDGKNLVCRQDFRPVAPKQRITLNNLSSTQNKNTSLETVEISNKMSQSIKKNHPEAYEHLKNNGVLMICIESREYSNYSPPPQHDLHDLICTLENLEEEILPKNREIKSVSEIQTEPSLVDLNIENFSTEKHESSSNLDQNSFRGSNEINMDSSRSAQSHSIQRGNQISSRVLNTRDNNIEVEFSESPYSFNALTLQGKTIDDRKSQSRQIKDNLGFTKITFLAITPFVVHTHGKEWNDKEITQHLKTLDYKLDNIRKYYESGLCSLNFQIKRFIGIDFKSYCPSKNQQDPHDHKKIFDMPVLFVHALFHMAGIDIKPLYCTWGEFDFSSPKKGFIYIKVVSDYFDNENNRQKFLDAFTKDNKDHAKYHDPNKNNRNNRNNENDKKIHEFHISIHEFNKYKRKAYEYVAEILKYPLLRETYLNYHPQKTLTESPLWKTVILSYMETMAKNIIGIGLQADTLELSLISMYGIKEPLDWAMFEATWQEMFYCDFYLTLSSDAAKKLTELFNQDFKNEFSEGMLYIGHDKYFPEDYNGKLAFLRVDIRSFLLPEFEKKFKNTLKFYNNDFYRFKERLMKQASYQNKNTPNKDYLNIIAVDLKDKKKEPNYNFFHKEITLSSKNLPTPKKIWKHAFEKDFRAYAKKKIYKNQQNASNLFLNCAQILDKNASEFKTLCSGLEKERKEVGLLLTRYAKLFWCAYQLYRLGKCYLQEHPSILDNKKLVKKELKKIYKQKEILIEKSLKENKEETALKNASVCIYLSNKLIEIAVTQQGMIQNMDNLIPNIKHVLDQNFFLKKQMQLLEEKIETVTDCLSNF